MATKPVKIGRDARDGRFVPVAEAKSRPSTTTVETIRKPEPSKPKPKGK